MKRVLGDVATEIETPLETNEERNFEDVEDADEEEEAEVDNPISQQQRQTIYSLVSDGFIDRDGDSANKYINLVKKISTFNESQANAFIECLRASKHVKTHNILSSRILGAVAKGVIHPEDTEAVNELSSNEFVNSQISELVGTFLSYFGATSSLVIVFLYSACSYLKYSDSLKKYRNGETNNPKSERPSTTPTIQNDNVREEPYGQNNITGEVIK